MGQRIIGLTGGIATGKSTVAHYLAQHHQIPILDADLYARQAVVVGSPILAAIAQRYGPTLLNPDGSLHRARLGEIIFQDPAEKTWVEAQIHPWVRQRFAQEMAELAAAPVVVQMIPLLFEAGLTAQVTEIWVVACPEAQQLERLQGRDNLTATAALARIHSQWPLGDKIARAHHVLHNDGSLPNLYHQIEIALQAPVA